MKFLELRCLLEVLDLGGRRGRLLLVCQGASGAHAGGVLGSPHRWWLRSWSCSPSGSWRLGASPEEHQRASMGSVHSTSRCALKMNDWVGKPAFSWAVPPGSGVCCPSCLNKDCEEAPKSPRGIIFKLLRKPSVRGERTLRNTCAFP